jgi:peroxiredoxin
VELQSFYSTLEEIGVPVWAISGDEPDRLRAFRDREGIEFDLLLDPDGTTFRSYGILNERHDKTVPHPTVIVVDSERIARYVVSDENFRVRPAAREVVEAAGGLVVGVDSQ